MPISKSVCNRELILHFLHSLQEAIPTISSANDSQVMLRALTQTSLDLLPNQPPNTTTNIDVEDAGTAMRFLTAYFAARARKSATLSGTERMQQRPIEPLVTALRKMGASITYLGKEGYPPLQILGADLGGGTIQIEAGISSQFISALMMIGTTCKAPLTLNLQGQVLSKPYISLTAELIRNRGYEVVISEDWAKIKVTNSITKSVQVKNAMEADWSAIWYFVAAGIVAGKFDLTFPNLQTNSPQGDAKLMLDFEKLGVVFCFDNNELNATYNKEAAVDRHPHKWDLVDQPDQVQTIAVMEAALGNPAKISGTKNLKWKETDRIPALTAELSKIGCSITASEDQILLEPKGDNNGQSQLSFDTYYDHRMAMCLAILSAKWDGIKLKNPEVTSKSFPDFFNQFSSLITTL